MLSLFYKIAEELNPLYNFLIRQKWSEVLQDWKFDTIVLISWNETIFLFFVLNLVLIVIWHWLILTYWLL